MTRYKTGQDSAELSCSDAVRRELAQARHREAQLARRLTAIESSTSWRITAPLRWLVSLVLRRRTAIRRVVEETFRASALVPHELLRSDAPAGGSDSSCRLVDAAPLLADLLPESVIESFRGAVEVDAPIRFEPADANALTALVGSLELARELAFETPVVQLHPSRWRVQIEGRRPDFVLVDGDLHRMSPAWARCMNGDAEATSELVELLAHCRRSGIPTALWLRVDATNFELLARFIPLVDRVYAIDSEILSRVDGDFGAGRGSLLPPAIQPRLNNPVNTPVMRAVGRELASQVMEDALADYVDPAASRRTEPTQSLLVESYWDVGCSRVRSLLPTDAQVVGVVDGLDKIALSRMVGGEFFASRRRPRWRSQLEMLRAAASGALVGFDPADAIRWPPEIQVPSAASTPSALKSLLADALRAASVRQETIRIASGQTIGARLQRIRSDLGLSPTRGEPRVSCLLVSQRPERLASCVATFRRFGHANKELIIVVHGDGSELQDWTPALPEDVQMLRASSSSSLGDCLNLAFARSSGEFWAKLDDDDYYGPNYLTDLIALAQSVQCDVVGKPLVFTAFERDGSLFWDPHRYAMAHTLYTTGWPRGVVCGATLAGRRDAIERLAFPNQRRQGTDTEFLDACARAGLRLLAGDGFGFACVRSDKPGFHTWEGEEADIRKHATKVGNIDRMPEVVDA